MAYIAEWFKVIRDDKLLGVVTDQSFARYSVKSGRLHICKAIDGQYLFLNDRLYRDDWMLPLDPEAPVKYESATVISISEKEYDILNKVDVSEPVNISDLPVGEPDIVEKVPKETEKVTIEFVRERKLKELSEVCQTTIENGFSLVLSDGASHHFSLSREDQLNLVDLQRALNLNDDLIYHADGELMQFYSQEDALDILIGAKKWKNYNLTLYNSYKNWINSIGDISVIDSITYESEIPDEYCTAVLEHLTENF